MFDLAMIEHFSSPKEHIVVILPKLVVIVAWVKHVVMQYSTTKTNIHKQEEKRGMSKELSEQKVVMHRVDKNSKLNLVFMHHIEGRSSHKIIIFFIFFLFY